MDLRSQLAVLRAHRLLIIAAIVIAAVTAVVVTAASQKVYESRATLIVGQSLSSANPDIGQIDTSQRLATTYAQIATTRPILEGVIEELGLDTTADELRESVSAEPEANSTLFTITVERDDPGTAAAIANEISDRLIAASPAVSGEPSEVQDFVAAELATLQQQIKAAQDEALILAALDTRTTEQNRQLAELEARLSSLRSSYATLYSQSVTSSANQLSVVEPAIPEPEPTSPNMLLNLVLALIAGGLVGIGAAFLIEHMDDKVKTVADAQRTTGLPVLGVVPRMPASPRGEPMYSLVTLAYPRSGAAESFRVLRTNLEFSSVDAAVRVIVVSSPLPDEGKTTCATNLAVAFAQAGKRTLLVDADLRRPGVHAVFRTEQEPGLVDLLRTSPMPLTTVLRSTEDANLLLITSGAIPPNPAELLGSARFEALLKRLATKVDVVILDAPPVNIVTDAVLLAKVADGTVLVVDASRTHRDSAREACDALARVGARVLGIALNRSRETDDQRYGYYDDSRVGQVRPTPAEPDAHAPLTGTGAQPQRVEESRP